MIYFKKFTLLQNSVLSSFFWHQLQDVLVMHGRARTILNGDVKIDLPFPFYWDTLYNW